MQNLNGWSRGCSSGSDWPEANRNQKKRFSHGPTRTGADKTKSISRKATKPTKEEQGQKRIC